MAWKEISGPQWVQLGIPRRSIKGYRPNSDSGFVDARCLRRYKRKFLARR